MKTTLQFVDLVWARLNADVSLNNAIDGGIYKQKRPDGSIKKDVVVNSLAVDNEQLQRGVINVNIHVPNLLVVINEQPDNSQPDHVTLNEISQIVIGLLKDYWGTEFHCDIQTQSLIEEPELKENFVNIRVSVFSINI